MNIDKIYILSGNVFNITQLEVSYIHHCSVCIINPKSNRRRVCLRTCMCVIESMSACVCACVLAYLRVPIVQQQVRRHHVVVLLIHQRILDLFLREAHLNHQVYTHTHTRTHTAHTHRSGRARTHKWTHGRTNTHANTHRQTQVDAHAHTSGRTDRQRGTC